MKHKHRIKPGYEGGEYCEGNVVELSVTQHAMWHYAEWRRKGNWQDKTAWQALAGQIGYSEATLESLRQGGRMAAAIVHSEKDEDGKSLFAKRMVESQKKLPDGRRAVSVKNVTKTNETIHSEKDCWGRSKHTLKNTQQKPIRLINLKTGETHDFPSQGVAAKVMGLHQSKLSEVLNGHRKSTGGFYVQLLEEVS